MLRGTWSRALLTSLGNTNPSDDIIRWVAAWTAAEFDPTQKEGAKNNPLATTQGGHGSDQLEWWNPVGVKQYPTVEDGLAATRDTFLGTFRASYATLLEGMMENKPVLAQAGLLASPWGTIAGDVWDIYKNAPNIANTPLPSIPNGGEAPKVEAPAVSVPGPSATKEEGGTVGSAVQGMLGPFLADPAGYIGERMPADVGQRLLLGVIGAVLIGAAVVVLVRQVTGISPESIIKAVA
jgi:hypothetical protein